MKRKYILLVGGFIILGAAVASWVFYADREEAGREIQISIIEGENGNGKEDLIRVDRPAPGEEIESPLEISGFARGVWFFEASFPIRLVDGQGNVLGRTIAEAQSDWMTEDFVPFKARLVFDSKEAVVGKLIFEKDDPSGLPEHADSFEMPVKFSQEKTMEVKVFFSNKKSETEMDCTVVYPLSRTIPKTQAVARAAMEQLLAGPSEEEKEQGYFTSINPDIELQNVSIQHGVAFVHFDPKIEESVGGSCRVAAIRAQIIETMRQFPTVEKVVISINGRTEDVLQP